eukprot:1195179-Prorocentrum_minimum.AAC.5
MRVRKPLVLFESILGSANQPPQPLTLRAAHDKVFRSWDEGLAGKALFARPTSPRLDPTSPRGCNLPCLGFPHAVPASLHLPDRDITLSSTRLQDPPPLAVLIQSRHHSRARIVLVFFSQYQGVYYK